MVQMGEGGGGGGKKREKGGGGGGGGGMKKEEKEEGKVESYVEVKRATKPRGTEFRVHCNTAAYFFPLLSLSVSSSPPSSLSSFLPLPLPPLSLSPSPPFPLPPIPSLSPLSPFLLLLPSPLSPLLAPPSSLPLLSPLLIGPVKKCGLLKILHERYRSGPSKQRVSLELQEFRQTLQEVAEDNRDLQPHIAKAQVMGTRL